MGGKCARVALCCGRRNLCACDLHVILPLERPRPLVMRPFVSSATRGCGTCDSARSCATPTGDGTRVAPCEPGLFKRRCLRHGVQRPLE